MEQAKLEPGTVIGNVNTLDLRKATPETVANIKKIGNVNVLLHSRETAALIPKLNLGNVNVTVEAHGDAQVITGQLVIGGEYLHEREKPVFLVVTGQLLVTPDVSAQDLEKWISGLVVVGQIVCPKSLAGVVQAKTVTLVGNSTSYPPQGRLVQGSLVINETYLQGLEDQSDLVVLGSLRLPELVSNDLLAQKLRKLHVTGAIRVHEENAAAIQARLSNGASKMMVIPTGYTLVENPLILDGVVLGALPSAKLYCLDRVEVEPATSFDVLDEQLDQIVIKDILVCPVALKGVMSRKCNVLETKALFYEGELWLVEGEEELHASRFEYLSGKATLVVVGELCIDPGLEPRLLADRLARVHNLGAINCTDSQMGAIQARLGLNEGWLGSKEEELDEGDRHVGNVNHLVL